MKNAPFQVLADAIERQGHRFLYQVNPALTLNPPLSPVLKSFLIVGIVAPASMGTALHDIGDADIANAPLCDGTPIDGVLTLMRPLEKDPFYDDIWDAQINKLCLYQSTMNARYRPKTDNPHSTQTVIDIKFPKIRPRERDDGIVTWRDISQVVPGATYHPSIMDHASHPVFNYRKDVLLQPNIYDSYGHMVPPWLLQSELRPHTMVLADVYPTVTDSVIISDTGTPRSCRTFEIWAKNVKVLQRGTLPMEKNFLPSYGAIERVSYRPREVRLKTKRVARMSTGGKPPRRRKSAQSGIREGDLTSNSKEVDRIKPRLRTETE
ncbi:hypothetical protein JR316_0011649 [Psilocybe cubensis]|uniref:Uncharacterized protein n=2 Tax=Psilocybe cubensis TaxID=181762 RepID=A0ACB8GKF5_PSICU|nr:hypothetical protein JR316_0012547 [Psilocybe cubensis]XP_047743704.1 hypothetical protein JR316_0011649 [Psilocybe cubensis]KAH9475436.1 hypothetical protein JR316_0012547 [Psilocybe cubensis]KAH9476079.1 hypothetical protein JR316_0011649 [Psilocybe cubensis]